MFIRSRLAGFFLIFTLVSCTTRPAALPTATMPPGLPATDTAPLPLPTRTLRPTETPVPTYTPQPTPTSRFVSGALPVPKPLAGEAPWLIYPCAEPNPNGVLLIASGNGTGCVPFTLPASIPADRTWISSTTSRGSYAAFRVGIDPRKAASRDAVFRLQPNGLDDQLWIVKLPENRVIRKIAQIDSNGWLRIEQMWKETSGATEKIPLPLAVILDPGAYRWSPNGRYLAYTGIDQQGVDLFVYDSLQDSIRRMSRRHNGAYIWDWSPDSKWMVYHEMAACPVDETGCQLWQGPHYYAVSFDGSDYQFANSFPAAGIDWISKNSYILKDIPQQGLSSRLARIDLKYGTVTNLYEGPFYAYTYVPETYVTRQERYLLNLPGAPGSDRRAGIYDLYPTFAKDRLRPFHLGSYADYYIQWERTLERFVLAKTITDEPAPQRDVRLVSIFLQEPVALGVLGSADLHLSPDGNWFTARLAAGRWALFSKEGQQILDLGKALPDLSLPVRWLKDSSGFYYFAAGEVCGNAFGCVYRFDQAQGWKPVLVDMFKGSGNTASVIEP